MKEIIKLVSKNSTNAYLQLLYRKDGKESKTYLLKTSSETLRVGHFSNGRNFIIPAEGSIIIEGQRLAEANATVKSIDFSSEFGHTITFL